MTDFQRQKEEAAERVRRMNASYRKKAGLDKPQNIPPVPAVKAGNSTPFDVLKMFRFDSIKSDPDRFLIMCVLLLLSSEKCDEKLLYALLYIML